MLTIIDKYSNKTMLTIMDKYSNKTNVNNHGQILQQNICQQSLTNTQTKHMLVPTKHMLAIIDKYSNKTYVKDSLTNTQTKHMLTIIDKYSNKTYVNNHGQILKQNIC